MVQTPCKMCGGEIWTRLRGNWKRCINCGYLETTTQDRICKTCGKEIGRYAKETLLHCFDCNKEKPEEPGTLCSTVGCGNRLGQKQLPSGICKQCNREKNDWLTPNGHLWKSKALFVLNEMQPRGELLRILLTQYPELTRDILNSWLMRQMKHGTVERVKHGLYQTIGEAAPEPPEGSRIIIVAGEPGSGVTIHRIPDD